jgi:hypothetical protein
MRNLAIPWIGWLISLEAYESPKTRRRKGRRATAKGAAEDAVATVALR